MNKPRKSATNLGAATTPVPSERPNAGSVPPTPRTDEDGPERIKVSTGADLLAYIPHVVGYWPANSLVCLGMAGPRVRATMRLDLPTTPDSDPMGYAQAAAAHLRTDTEADGSLIAFFCASDWTVPSQNPQGKLFSAMVQAFADVGLPIRDAWYVGPNHWRHIGCRDADCCGWPGLDVASILGSRLNAELVYRGSSVGTDPYERIPRLVEPDDPERVQQVDAAAAAVRGSLTGCGNRAAQLCLTLAVWERALSQPASTLDVSLLGFLQASVSHVGVRDTVLVSLATGIKAALCGAAGAGIARPGSGVPVLPVGWNINLVQELVATLGEKTTRLQQHRDAALMRKAADDYADVLMGGHSGHGPAPDWNRVDSAEELLLFLARSTVGPAKAPLLCMLGWIQWCRGRGTWSGVYLTLAQECRPGYRLAALLEQLLDVGCIAGWAKNEATAWRGGRRLGQVA